MKLVFAPDTSEHPNWGCRVMGEWFKRALIRRGVPPAWIAPNAWFLTHHPGLEQVHSLDGIRRLAREVQAGRILGDIAAILSQCDGVLLNGENFVRPGTHKGRMLLFLAYLVKQVFGKPCILANHSVDLDEPELATIAREVYPLLDEVHFREGRSVEVASHLVGAGKWKLIPDVAFAVPASPLAEWAELGSREGHFSAWPDSAEGFDPRRPYVTVCASSLYAQPEHRHLDMAPAFVKLCRRLQQDFDQVLLAAPCEVDTEIMRKVRAATGLPLLGPHLPVRQAIDVIGNAAVHVGGRWHPAIFAATGGTPAVPFSANSHKVESLMGMLGTEATVFDALRIEERIEAIAAQARSCRDAGAPLRRRLQARSRELGAQVERCLDGLLPPGEDYPRA